ncbi:hypothetical protein GCM10009415_38420 [Chitinophaga japonensis]
MPGQINTFQCSSTIVPLTKQFSHAENWNYKQGGLLLTSSFTTITMYADDQAITGGPRSHT